jgi:hypothetical protein
MKGKYDGRRNNGRYKSTVKRGPKPQWLKHLSRNSAGKVLEAFDGIATWSQIYARAWEAGKLESCIQMRLSAEYRLFGEPFTAENPEKAAKSNVLDQDGKLQGAIKDLIPQRLQAKSKTVM